MTASTIRPVESTLPESIPDAKPNHPVPEQFNGDVGPTVANVQDDIEATAQGPDHPKPQRDARPNANQHNIPGHLQPDPAAADESHEDNGRHYTEAPAKIGAGDELAEVDSEQADEHQKPHERITKQAGSMALTGSTTAAEQGTEDKELETFEKTRLPESIEGPTDDGGDDPDRDIQQAVGDSLLWAQRKDMIRQTLADLRGPQETVDDAAGAGGDSGDNGNGEPPDGNGESAEGDSNPNGHINMPDLVVHKLDKPLPPSFEHEVERRFSSNLAADTPVASGDQLYILNGLKDGKTVAELAAEQGTTEDDIDWQLVQFGVMMQAAGHDMNFSSSDDIDGIRRSPLYVNTAIQRGLIDRPEDAEELTSDLTSTQERDLLLMSLGYDRGEITDRTGEERRADTEKVSDARMRAKFGAVTNAHLVALAESRDAIPGLEIIKGRPLPEEFRQQIEQRADAVERPAPIEVTDVQRAIVTGLANDKTLIEIAAELGISPRTVNRDFKALTNQFGFEVKDGTGQPAAVYMMMLHGQIVGSNVGLRSNTLTRNEQLQLFLTGNAFNRSQIADGIEMDLDAVRSARDSIMRKLAAGGADDIVHSMHAAVGRAFEAGIFKPLPENQRSTDIYRLVRGRLHLTTADEMVMPEVPAEPSDAADLETNSSYAQIVNNIARLKPGEFLLFDDEVPDIDLFANGQTTEIVEVRPDPLESAVTYGRHAVRSGVVVLPSGETVPVLVHPFYISPSGYELHQVATAYDIMRGTSSISQAVTGQQIEHPVGFYCTGAIDVDGNRTRQIALLSRLIPSDNPGEYGSESATRYSGDEAAESREDKHMPINMPEMALATGEKPSFRQYAIEFMAEASNRSAAINTLPNPDLTPMDHQILTGLASGRTLSNIASELGGAWARSDALGEYFNESLAPRLGITEPNGKTSQIRAVHTALDRGLIAPPPDLPYVGVTLDPREEAHLLVAALGFGRAEATYGLGDDAYSARRNLTDMLDANNMSQVVAIAHTNGLMPGLVSITELAGRIYEPMRRLPDSLVNRVMDAALKIENFDPQAINDDERHMIARWSIGVPDRTIAAELNIPATLLSTSSQSLINRLNASDRASAVQSAWRHGLINFAYEVADLPQLTDDQAVHLYLAGAGVTVEDTVRLTAEHIDEVRATRNELTHMFNTNRSVARMVARACALGVMPTAEIFRGRSLAPKLQDLINKHEDSLAKPIQGLSKYEKMILSSLSAGQTEQQIADGLGISRQTVYRYVDNSRWRLYGQNTASTVYSALLHRLIPAVETEPKYTGNLEHNLLVHLYVLATTGLNERGIAELMELTENQVRNAHHAIRTELKATSMHNAVAIAFGSGIFQHIMSR